MTLYRCFAWDAAADEAAENGPKWFPRKFQGEGRHDSPDLYGCLYLADQPLSGIVEQLARFRSQRLSAGMLRRRGLPLALATLELDSTGDLIDLDEPRVLRRERLRPSRVATRHRETTQSQARTLFVKHPKAAGLRWWSVLESLWTHVTLFDRAAQALTLTSVRVLTVTDPAVVEAEQFLVLPRRAEAPSRH